MKNTNYISKGMTLLEVLVVITIFAVLGILVTESVALTLQGAKKSASIVRARENLDYSMAIIERQIRGAGSITSQCTTPPATPAPAAEIDYTDQYGKLSSFFCVNTGGNDSYIASGSSLLTASRLTNDTVKIAGCLFTCITAPGSNPPEVDVDLAMQDASASGIQSASASASTRIYLRNY